MTYAPHTNTDVQQQLRQGCIPTPLPLILGCFRNKETKAFFEYAERRWHTDDFAPELPHIFYTIDGPRLCKVFKTVAYIAVDEDADGNAVIEKWLISGHRKYPTEWVRRSQ